MDTISHNTLLFNVHDLVLLLSVSFCVVLASVFSYLAYQKSDKTSLLLAAILFLFAVQSLDTLIIWSTPLRLLVLDWQPSIFFWGGLGFWLQGPLLFWLVHCKIDPKFKFRRLSYLHLLPAIIVATLLIINYHALPLDTQIEKMRNLGFLSTALMDHIKTSRYLSMIGYSGLCLTALSYRQKQLVKHDENSLRLYLWLKLGASASMIMAAWPLLVHLSASRISTTIANFMGLTSNYLLFIFIISFIFIMLKACNFSQTDNAIETTNLDETAIENDTGEVQLSNKPELVKRLENHMIYEKPFLKCNINLEILASQLSLPERTLSRVINQHCGQNIVEFINSYRIIEAKKLLIEDINNEKSMLTIMEESGFNSKSTFNSIFKQQVGMTPSQFRKTNK